MVDHHVVVSLRFPRDISYTQDTIRNLHRGIEEVLRDNIHLLTSDMEGRDMTPIEVVASFPDYFGRAYQEEARYLHEESDYIYEEDEERVELTKEDYEEIGFDVAHDDWLNDAITNSVTDSIRRRIEEKREDSDNNEI